ncbi:pentapeptide repeat-containing protein [Leifsonia kafniensis]|uniref:pentapeptide repeat-containing protein n=1 Tax=Leifsonia kafniensis TaxID=475957 RepID=UPI003CD06B85
MRPFLFAGSDRSFDRAGWDLRWVSLLPAPVADSASAPVTVDGVDLRTPSFDRVDLHRVDLHRVDLHRVDLHRVDLHCVDLHRVDLHCVDLHCFDLAEFDVFDRHSPLAGRFRADDLVRWLCRPTRFRNCLREVEIEVALFPVALMGRADILNFASPGRILPRFRPPVIATDVKTDFWNGSDRIA